MVSGARTEERLRQNPGAAGRALADGQTAKLDAASARPAPCPYSPYERQEGFARLNPPAVGRAAPAAG